jgi:peptidyl-prolyl cis-trans isomerase B (cyclophilin B)
MAHQRQVIALLAGSLLALAAACGDSETAPTPQPLSATAAAQENPMDELKSFIEEQVAAGRIDKDSSGWKTNLPEFPKLSYDSSKNYFWNVETNLGAIKIRFMPDIAPNHVSNYLYLTELGFFDGLSFHRVITGFMAQGGDPLGVGSGGPGYKFEGELNPDVKHDKPGLLSMANTGQPKSDGSQFFLTFVPTPWLDMKHTVFGEVVDGMQTVQDLEARGSQGGSPTAPLSIVRATITVE